jgi:hypothetical protein
VLPQTFTVSPGLAAFTPACIVVYAGPDPAQLFGEAAPSWSTMIVAPNAAAAVSASVAPTATGNIAHRIRIFSPSLHPVANPRDLPEENER